MNKSIPRQCFSVLNPGEEYTVPSDHCYVRIERLSIIDNPTVAERKRLVVMAKNTAKTADGRDVTFEVAIGSFILGKDYDQPCDILFSPADHCTLTMKGAENQRVQIQYTTYLPN